MKENFKPKNKDKMKKGENKMAITKLKLIICSECFTVKAVLANVFGNTSWCQACRKATKHIETHVNFEVDRSLSEILRMQKESLEQ